MAANQVGRINLAFNLNNEKEKMVYTFLQGAEKSKTKVITEMVCLAISQQKKDDNFTQGLLELIENTIKQSLLDNPRREETAPEEKKEEAKEEVVNKPTINEENWVNDDAFEAMQRIFGQ